MPDAPDPDSSNDSSPAPNTQEWYIQQWEALCEELGASTPNEVLSRVQTLRRQADLDDRDHEEEGLVTISEVEEVFRELNGKIAKLRQRNATLVERLEAESDVEAPLKERHQKTEELLDTIGVDTIDAAQSHVAQLERQLEELYQEKEQLTQAGLSDAEDALEELEQVREERDTLKQERDELERQLADAEEAAASSGGPDTSALEVASVIRDEIGISSLEQAIAFKKVVKDVHDRIQRRAHAYDLAPESTPDDVVGMLRNMTNNLSSFPAPTALPAEAATVLGVEDASDVEALADAADQIAAGLAAADDDTAMEALPTADTDDVLTVLTTLADRIDQLDSEDTTLPDDALPAEAANALGIHTVEEAQELNRLIDDMSHQLDQLRTEHEKLAEADLSVEGALTMIDNMKAQLVDLYHQSDQDENGQVPNESARALQSLDAPLVHRINTLIDLPDEANDLSTVIERLVERLDTLTSERALLDEAGLTVKDAITLIDNMEAQLSELYEQQEQEGASDAAERLAAIEDVLGISTRQEAEELSEIAHRMEEQLTDLYEEKAKLQELGLSSIDDAVDMIQSMETQLGELYEDKEALRDAQEGSTDQQSTFQQLEALYAERQKLQETLGVSSAEEVIELVESLNTQLEDLYTGRDAEVAPEERHEAQLWSPESPESEAPADDAAADTAPTETSEEPDEASPNEVDSLTMSSMEHQLEALYQEKEVLLRHGFGSADEAMARLQTQKRQIDVLQRENHTYEQRFSQLRSEFGTERVPHIVELVRTLESEASTSLDELASSGDTSDYGVNLEAASPFVEADTLSRLDDMTPEERNELDVGVVRLDPEGTVKALNDAALQLPSLHSVSIREDAIGQNFFLDLAPSTNNNLFFGRFQKGQSRGEIDARFPYTFTSPNKESESFAVHLYRAPDSDTTWLLFRPA